LTNRVEVDSGRVTNELADRDNSRCHKCKKKFVEKKNEEGKDKKVKIINE